MKMNEEKVKEIVLKTIEGLPKKYKFELINVESSGKSFFVDLLSPEKTSCQIQILSGQFELLTGKEFIGAIAHEFAHYWTKGVSKEYFEMMHVFKLKAIEMAVRKTGQFRKAERIKKEYSLHLKDKKDIGRLNEAWEKYVESEEKTDSFAKEKFGFKKEVEAMRKVYDKYELALYFKDN